MINRALLATAFAGSLLLSACDRPTVTEARLAPTDAPSFITYGALDGTAHPAVVLVLMEVAGKPAYRCSGTLLSKRVVLTAGHCAGEPGEFSGIRIFTESDVDNGNNNYPFAGPNAVEARAWHSHPLFTEAAFFLHDVGVIELAADVTLPASAYGRLPTANQLDALSPGRGTGFTSVGYGVQSHGLSRSTRASRAADPFCCPTTPQPVGRALATPAARTFSEAATSLPG
jgi:Trypsin